MFVYQKKDANGLEHLYVRFGAEQIPFTAAEEASAHLDVYETEGTDGVRARHIKIDGKEVSVATPTNNED